MADLLSSLGIESGHQEDHHQDIAPATPPQRIDGGSDQFNLLVALTSSFGLTLGFVLYIILHCMYYFRQPILSFISNRFGRTNQEVTLGITVTAWLGETPVVTTGWPNRSVELVELGETSRVHREINLNGEEVEQFYDC